jgi:hypothetical protein
MRTLAGMMPVLIAALLLSFASLSLSQKMGRFRIGAGVLIEDEVDTTGAGFMTVFGTGSVGAAF